MVGVNAFTEAEPSPLSGGDGAIMTVDADVEQRADRAAEGLARRRATTRAVKKALAELASAAKEDRNIMPASIACAHRPASPPANGPTTLRAVFGEYRAPTGVARAAGVTDGRLEAARREVETVSRRLGRRIKILVGKPGLDGHSNGAEQIAVRARDCGMEVVYEGIRLTPERIVNAALEESVHVVGLSILSGGHVSLVRDVMEGMREAGIGDVPVVVGGIIPPADAEAADQGRRRPRLHAQGLRPDADHARHRRRRGRRLEGSGLTRYRSAARRPELAVACSIASTTAWLNSQVSAWTMSPSRRMTRDSAMTSAGCAGRRSVTLRWVTEPPLPPPRATRSPPTASSAREPPSRPPAARSARRTSWSWHLLDEQLVAVASASSLRAGPAVPLRHDAPSQSTHRLQDLAGHPGRTR